MFLNFNLNMLNSFLFSHKFSVFSQSGFNIDFIIKKLSEIFIRNFLIYGAQFFSEKFIIEYITKKSFNYLINNFNNFYYIKNLDYFMFFVTLINFTILYNFIYYFVI